MEIFDPSKQSYIDDPYSTFEKLRKHNGLYKSTFGFWIASQYDDVKILLKDKRFGKNYWGNMLKLHGQNAKDEFCLNIISNWMSAHNAPIHTQLRRAFNSTFSSKAISIKSDHIHKIVNDLIQELRNKATFDFLKEFAYLLPGRVIGGMLGIPNNDQENLISRAMKIARLLEMKPLSNDEFKEQNENMHWLIDYLIDLMKFKKNHPTDDVISNLSSNIDWKNDQCIDISANILLLFFAGHETTANLLGNGLLALYKHPEQLKLLQRNLNLIPNSIEEILRYDSPFQLTLRVALEEVNYNGVLLQAGDPVILLLASGNRDEKKFSMANALNIERNEAPCLSFGGGAHLCLGVHLARLEGALALEAFFNAFPNWAIRDVNSLEWRKSTTVRGLKSLVVETIS